MNYVLENWYMMFIVVVITIMGIRVILDFVQNKSKKQQLESVKEWLVYACLKAEKEFGSSTGQIKLRYVYDMFVTNFTSLSKMVTFTQFSGLVDYALTYMKQMINSNEAVAKIVEKED